MKMAIAAGVTALFIAGIGVGIPRVMAADRPVPVPAPAPAGPGVPTGWPAAKAAAMAAENQSRQAAAGRPVVAPAEIGSAGAGGKAIAGTESQAAAMAPRAAYTAGILPLTDGGPFGSARFVGTNLWNGPVGGRWEVVQAGGSPTDRALGGVSPTRAGLFVYTESPDPAVTAGRRVVGVLAPAADPRGSFTVAKARGNTLTLTLSGSRVPYYFNVATRVFTR